MVINLNFIKVSFTYATASKPIVDDLTISFQTGWTGIIGANSIGKTTIAMLAIGQLTPQQGSIQTATQKKPNSLYCAQSTADLPAFTEDFFTSSDNEKGQLCSILKISDNWQKRWETLSHGERKRLQLAIMLWKDPEIIIVDEPTNHLDNSSKKIITQALERYKGLGIIISHDRELLDRLCKYCLFMDTRSVTLRPGGITEGLEQQENEDKAKQREYDKNYAGYRKLSQTSQKLKQEVSTKEKHNTKKKLDKYDSSGREKINLARLTNKDAIGSRKVQQINERAKKAKQNLAELAIKKKELKGFEFTGEIFPGNTLLRLSANKLKLAEKRVLDYPELDIGPTDRIGLIGDNGIGKSTLVRLLVSQLKIPKTKYIYIPQEFSAAEISDILNELHKLNRQDLGKLLTITDRLGSEPERIKETSDPSPGELRKIWLGLGLLKDPYLIIMDEPTNHLDYPSIACLEKALANFKGALLLVSHDLVFIKKLTEHIWNIVIDPPNNSKLSKYYG